jgi:hypothetical protein
MSAKENLNKYIIFALGCLIGALAFISLYGVKVLNVTYDDWLMTGGDLSQHYIGWRFFRASQWNFPLGLMDGLVYPHKVSVMYMDSIPIFAIIFKLLSPFLPATFQYFGIWGILSFMLQGGLAILIIRRFTSNYIICIVSELFFVFSPVMMQRMFAHTALAGHWVILLSIYLYLSKSHIDSLKKNIAIWSLLVFLSVVVHMYFFPMVMMILACHLVRDYLKNKSIFRVIMMFICPIVIALITLFILGAFYGNSSPDADGLGIYSANINALINPQGYSKYLINLPTATNGQGEGFAYLGLGIISALFVVIYIKIEELLKLKKEKFIEYIKNNPTNFLLFIAAIIFFILALSPVVSLNKNILFTIPCPAIIKKIWSIFRSTGRFMWPILYIIYIYVIKQIICKSTKKHAIIFLCICTIIQISDLSNIIIQKNDYFSKKMEYVSQLKSSIWSDLAHENYKHIVFLKNVVGKEDLVWSFCDYAIKNNMTVNDANIARKDSEFIDQVKNQYIEELKKGNGENDTIYVFGNSEDANKVFLPEYPLNYYNIDGIIIGVKEQIPGMEEYRATLVENLKNGVNILPRNNQYIKNGEDKDNVRKLSSEGISYGPYIALGMGSYNVVITGNNLEKINYDISYNQGKNTVKTQEISKSDKEIVLKFTLDNDLEDFEFRIFNKGQQDIILNSISISK